jgi:hypothetical protein
LEIILTEDFPAGLNPGGINCRRPN